MQTQNDQRLAKIIGRVTARLQQELPGADSSAAAKFATRFFSGALPEDVEHEASDNLFGMAAAVWEHIRVREAHKPKIRAYNPNIEAHGWHSPHSVVEVVTDNSPFLLDSTVAALNLLDLTIHLVIHPVVEVERDQAGRAVKIADTGKGGENTRSESFIHVQVTRQTDPDDFLAITSRLSKVFADVRAAVEDWERMLGWVEELIEDTRIKPLPIAQEEVEEGLAFLEWLRDGNFTFLGARDYSLEEDDGASYLRIVDTQGLGILREVSAESRARHDLPISGTYSDYLRRPELFLISKAWTRSNVHRPVYMDYIGVRRFDEVGRVVGERRFLGLLTSTAYSTRPVRIPLLRRKVETVLQRSGFSPGDHDAKALANILDNYPRDELFQVDLETLENASREILRLEHRQRIRLFLRRDGHAEFFSALVFVPRDAYSTDLRQRVERILIDRLGGHSAEVATQLSEAPMVRAHFIVHIEEETAVDPDIAEIEREIVASARSWEDELMDALIESKGEAEGTRLHRRYAAALPASYKADFAARAAVEDISRIESLSAPNDIALNLYRRVAAEEGEVDFKVYHCGDSIPLSRMLPMLEHMGFIVHEEHPYTVPRGDEHAQVVVHDFRMISEYGWALDIAASRVRLEQLFAAVWHGTFESDGFNALIQGGLDGREIALVRAYAKYLRQIKAPFSLSYMQETLTANPELARLLIRYFRSLHNPKGVTDTGLSYMQIRRSFLAGLDNVSILDQDRILRRFLNLIDATLRTNFFQRDSDGDPKPSIALKFDTAAVDELPSPRPWREIFVFHPKFEAVHLRGGSVARGGIRWSDRREDFRTEILGLVKAQMVKNAVIVPVGAKGGFVLKSPPTDISEFRQEGVACYRLFMSALLDITDNLVSGEIQTRDQLFPRDGEDAYLVVAADKGTATFSDFANEVAGEYAHWLGDAYASGGSAGYDHKTMGITARGAWEAVKRHFRELGKDIQSEAFSAVGIGDMAGDVFGNGMLLSECIRLVAAFNHLHVFVDPKPDPTRSFAERKRLFEMNGSSWEDYDPGLISEGGGVFSRQAKSIAVTPQMKERFGISSDYITPNLLIRAILCADVDLLWNGGIGTYVKARSETNAEVDDRGNDPLRVNGAELRCKVIGEGGNLGMTQAGRIEFALAGGRVNTDAIDNSAGVDCSDHEVNIKILLGSVVDAGDMTTKQRDRRLADMTGEVAQLVLRHNYVQTQCLSMVESLGTTMFEEQVRFLHAQEARGLLDRAVEGLPNEDELVEWRTAGRLFTRPELAVLLAYAKMSLYDDLLNSEFPDDPYLRRELFTYFPAPLRKDFPEHIQEHRLSREIVATRAANSVIDRAGITFVHRHTEHSGIAPAAVVRAYLQARDVFALPSIWRSIEKTDNVVAARAQAGMHVRIMSFLDHMTSWFLRHVPMDRPMDGVVEEYRSGVTSLEEALDKVLDEGSRETTEQDVAGLLELGVPDELALALARLQLLSVACDIVQVAREAEAEPAAVGGIFFEVGRRFACDWLRNSSEQLPRSEHWDMLAAKAIAEDSYAHQRSLTAHVLAFASGQPEVNAVDEWAKKNEEPIRRFKVVFGELSSTTAHSLAMLNVVNRSLRVLTESL